MRVNIQYSALLARPLKSAYFFSASMYQFMVVSPLPSWVHLT
jgi:hypothetical protein